MALIIAMPPNWIAEDCKRQQGVQHQNQRGSGFLLLLDQLRLQHVRDLPVLGAQELEGIAVLVALLVLSEGVESIGPIGVSLFGEVVAGVNIEAQVELLRLATLKTKNFVFFDRWVMEPVKLLAAGQPESPMGCLCVLWEFNLRLICLVEPVDW